MPIRLSDIPEEIVRLSDIPKQPPKRGIVRDIVGAVAEIPRNTEVGFLEAGEGLLRAVQRRGMEKPVSDETLRSLGFEPSGKPWKRPWISRKAEEMAENVAATKKRAIRKLGPVTLGSAPVRRLTRPVVQNLPSFGAMLGVSVLSGTPLAGLAVGAEMSAGSTFQQQMETHGNAGIANTVADLSGLAEAAGEALVFPKFVKGLSKGLPLREALILIAENAGQEGATGFAQRFIEVMGEQTAKGIDPRKAAKVAFGEGVKAVPENAWVGGAMALLPAGVGYVHARNTVAPSPEVYTAGVEASSAVTEAPAQPVAPGGWDTGKPAPRTVDDMGRDLAAEHGELPVVPQKPPESATQPELSVTDEQQPVTVAGEVLPAASPEQSAATEGERPSISTRNMDTAQVRAEEGLPPLVGGPRRSLTEHQALWTEAAPAGAVVDAITDEVLKKPRALTPAEEQGFRLRIEETRAEYDKLTAEAENLPAGSGALRANLAAREDLRSRNDKLTQVTRMAGREWAYTGLSRQNLLDDDTSPLAMTAKAEEKKGDKLTPEERTDVEVKTKAVKEATEKAVARRRTVAEKRANRAIRGGRNRYARMTEVEKDAELADLLEKIRTDPDNTDKLLYQAAMNIGSRPGISTVGDVAARLQEHIDGINTYSLSDAIVAAMQRSHVEKTLLEQALASLRREGRTNVNLRVAIDNVRWHLREGTVPERSETHRTYNEDLQALRNTLAHYTQELHHSKPAQKARLERVLARVNAQIASGDYGPRLGRADKPLRDPELENLEYQISLARKELYKRMAALDPWTKRLREHPLRAVTQPFREVQSWKSAFDFSALMKQGGIALRSHPIRTLRRVPEAFRAMFDPKLAFKINYELMHGERAWYYKRAGLELTDYDGNLTSREEEFTSSWLEGHKHLGKGLRASNRGFVTLLNVIRADAFNAMEGSFAPEGGLSLDESRAVATYVNVMTGRGSLRGLEKHAATLNGVLWSPRYTISRLQYETLMPLWQRGANWRVRKAITKEYARYLTGVAVTWGLYYVAFGGDIEKDPRSADAGKLKIGNVRLDPLSGLAQWTVMLGRQIAGQTKTQSGEIRSLSPSSPDFPYRGSTRLSVLGRFGRSKLGFFPGKVVDKLAGSDFIGRPWSWGRELTMAPIPLGFEDVYKLMEDQGVPKGLALETLNLFGDSVQVYDESEGAGRRIQRQRIRR
jgi:hypothetical protein